MTTASTTAAALAATTTGQALPVRRRLVICLDGTWNNQDDSTNVTHHATLAVEGPTPDGRFDQRVYYSEGVGTGPLDRITGGGFGFGLETNVRRAYEWLIEQYRDGDGPDTADEIYVFGFSRGAFTARSLVGFISRCGLLRRGAPMMVTELWEAYCIIGREREHGTSIWERLVPPAPAKFRELSALEHLPPAALTETEHLLRECSRRVNITYLGVYDTVGAMGFDALAIPGLRSRMALHHNMRPTTLIVQCRHALAMDEHRSSFVHTPFMAYAGGAGEADELKRARVQAPNTALVPATSAAMWATKIEQRWFRGAHSNIGGGMQSNGLAMAPIEWLLNGAEKQGLVVESRPTFQHAPKRIDDSFAHFASPLWVHLLRAKRNYRAIDPPPERRATRGGGPRTGFVLKSINETLHPGTVCAAVSGLQSACPNLCEYRSRPGANGCGCLPPRLWQRWLGGNWQALVSLLAWALLAAYGVNPAYVCFAGGSLPAIWPGVGLLIAGAFILVDRIEFRVNLQLAATPDRPLLRAARDSIYWTRAIGVVLFGFGAVTFLVNVAAWLVGLLGNVGAESVGLDQQASHAGALLFLQVAGVYLARACQWVGEPLRSANLGPLTRLQDGWTPTRAMRCLNGWRDALQGPATSLSEATTAMLVVLRETIWRDIIGFVPVYSSVFGFGAWMASRAPWGTVLATPVLGLPGWLWGVLIGASAGQLENVIYLHYARRYRDGRQPSVMLTGFACLTSMARWFVFGLNALLTLGVIVSATLEIRSSGFSSGWRGVIAFTLSVVGAVAMLALGAAATVEGIRRYRRVRTRRGASTH